MYLSRYNSISLTCQLVRSTEDQLLSHRNHYGVKGVICRLCNKYRDQGQNGIGVGEGIFLMQGGL